MSSISRTTRRQRRRKHHRSPPHRPSRRRPRRRPRKVRPRSRRRARRPPRPREARDSASTSGPSRRPPPGSRCPHRARPNPPRRPSRRRKKRRRSRLHLILCIEVEEGSGVDASPPAIEEACDPVREWPDRGVARARGRRGSRSSEDVVRGSCSCGGCCLTRCNSPRGRPSSRRSRSTSLSKFERARRRCGSTRRPRRCARTPTSAPAALPPSR